MDKCAAVTGTISVIPRGEEAEAGMIKAFEIAGEILQIK